MGRDPVPKPRCTKEAIKTAVELKRRGANDKDIAAALLVRPETFSRWINHPQSDNQSQLSQALQKVEAEYKANILAGIYNAGAKGQWQAFAWILERKYPQEYARQERPRIEEKQQEAQAPVFVFERGDDA